MQNTAKQNYSGSVAFYNTRPGNEVGVCYNVSEPTRGKQNLRLESQMRQIH